MSGGTSQAGSGLPIRTNARVLGTTLKAGETAEYPLGTGRYGYLVPAKASVEVSTPATVPPSARSRW